MTPSATAKPAAARSTSAGQDTSRSPGAGLSDVTRSVRVLARNSRALVTDTGEVLERELAMAVSLSERLRDESVSKGMLKEARALPIQSDVRDSAHRVVDLVADAVGVATVSAVRFAERMADEPRPPLASEEHDQDASAEASV